MAYLVAMALFVVTRKTDTNYHVTPQLIWCQDRSVNTSSWWSQFSRGLLQYRWMAFSRGKLLFPPILECCWIFADNQRTMRSHCAADTKSVAITFTFTLHYWIFIHWALSQWVMSWMIDEGNAFCLRDDWSSTIDTICRAFTLQEDEAACRKQQKNSNEQQQKGNILFAWHWIMGQFSHISMQ